MILYVYAGYPILAGMFALILNKRVVKGDYAPKVSILIAAYNEEQFIEATFLNKLRLEYPRDRLEIIVISDGSTDKTDEIVRNYEKEGVRLFRQEPRSGKTSALNFGVTLAEGELIVFSDANSIYDARALAELVSNFHDETVGYVTGKMIYVNDEGSAIGDGCSAYMRYENFLRSIEARLGSIVGVDGGIDAIRKRLYKPMMPDQLPDFVLPLLVVEQGYRVVYEPMALLMESTLTSPQDEFKMRVRVSLRALWALVDMRHILGFKHSVIFSWQLWSHKTLRYLCFMFLIVSYISNMLLWKTHAFYQVSFIVQNAFYLGALLAPLIGKNQRLLHLLHYFILLNYASLIAFLKFLAGQKQTLWTPRKG